MTAPLNVTPLLAKRRQTPSPSSQNSEFYSINSLPSSAYSRGSEQPSYMRSTQSSALKTTYLPSAVVTRALVQKPERQSPIEQHNVYSIKKQGNNVEIAFDDNQKYKKLIISPASADVAKDGFDYGTLKCKLVRSDISRPNVVADLSEVLPNFKMPKKFPLVGIENGAIYRNFRGCAPQKVENCEQSEMIFEALYERVKAQSTKSGGGLNVKKDVTLGSLMQDAQKAYRSF